MIKGYGPRRPTFDRITGIEPDYGAIRVEMITHQ